MKTCDVAVVGLGVMGSAALYALRARGVDVLGFDPRPQGDLGASSHGSCRIYRRFNFESPAYTPLSEEAFAGWSALEQHYGQRVLLPCPVVEAGPPGSTLVSGSWASAGPLRSGPCSGGEVNALFPAFNLPSHWDAAVQDQGGVLMADLAISLFRQGQEESIIPLEVALASTPSGVELRGKDGSTFFANRVILAPGPWVTDLVPELKKHVFVTRQPVAWFQPVRREQVQYPAFPIFIIDAPEVTIYGFPEFDGRGVKAAFHDHGRTLVRADDARQDAENQDFIGVRAALRRYVPAAAGPLIWKETCLYTNTRSGDVFGSSGEEFIIDRLPTDPRVILASPCSGHGFKFAPAIGEILAQLATDDGASADQAFSLKRFSSFAQ